jgi:predicted NAD/FAD-binding protein
MNDLQSISSQKHGNLFATLNPLSPPSPTRVLGHYAYSHPVLSTDSVRAQYELALLNAQAATTTTTTGPEPERSERHRVFAGAWTRYGFHEDGFASGLRAAAALPGVEPPFRVKDADIERGEPVTTVMPVARLFDVLEVVRACTALLVGRVLLVVFWAMGPVERKKVD